MALTKELTNTSRLMLFWEALGGVEDGTAADVGVWADKTITVAGTFGGATVAPEGSNDGTNWFPMHDYLGTEISFTDAGMALIMENPAFIRVTTTGGTGSDIDARISASLRN